MTDTTIELDRTGRARTVTIVSPGVGEVRVLRAGRMIDRFRGGSGSVILQALARIEQGG
jgi:hypothetical protein